MKKIALSLVTLSSILVLVACGSSNTASTSQSSSATKTSKTSKASSSSKTSSKSKTSSTKESQSQEQVAGSSETQASSAGASANNKEAEKTAEPAKAEATSPATPVPAAVVGTWAASTAQAKSVSMTIGADGSISVEANYGTGDEDYIYNYVGNGTAVEVRPGLYRWIRNGGDSSAFLAGVTGLGWAGDAKVEEGFLLQDGQYTPVLFYGTAGQELDYANKYQAFSNNVLTKQ